MRRRRGATAPAEGSSAFAGPTTCSRGGVRRGPIPSSPKRRPSSPPVLVEVQPHSRRNTHQPQEGRTERVQEQHVGIDLHRRSVMVRMNDKGEELSSLRTDNDPGLMATAIAQAGEHPAPVSRSHLCVALAGRPARSADGSTGQSGLAAGGDAARPDVRASVQDTADSRRVRFTGGTCTTPPVGHSESVSSCRHSASSGRRHKSAERQSRSKSFDGRQSQGGARETAM